MKSKFISKIIFEAVLAATICMTVFTVLISNDRVDIYTKFIFFVTGVIIGGMLGVFRVAKFKRTMDDERKRVLEMNQEELITNVIEILDDYIESEKDSLSKILLDTNSIKVSKPSERLQGMQLARDIIMTRYNFLFWNDDK